MRRYLYQPVVGRHKSLVVNWLCKLRDEGKIKPGSELHYVRLKDLYKDMNYPQEAVTLLLISPDNPEGPEFRNPVPQMLAQIAVRE